MRKLIFFILFGLMVAFIACNSKTSGNTHQAVNDTNSIINNKEVVAKPHIAEYSSHADTVKINYSANKVILDILSLLPDSAMNSRDWSDTERKNMVSSIKNNNYFIDRSENYNTIEKIQPHYFNTQVVDGTFSVACFKINTNSYMVITNDRTADNNYMQAYKFVYKKLTAVKISDLLGSYFDYFFVDPKKENCKIFYNTDNSYMNYSFEEMNKIKISAHFVKKEDSCLKGNSLTLEFNNLKEKFDLSNVEWGKIEY